MSVGATSRTPVGAAAHPSSVIPVKPARKEDRHGIDPPVPAQSAFVPMSVSGANGSKKEVGQAVDVRL